MARRTFMGSLTKHVGRRSIPAQCLGLLRMACGQEAVHVRVRQREPGKLARCAPGMRHVAERSRCVHQARSRRALCRRGQDGKHTAAQH